MSEPVEAALERLRAQGSLIKTSIEALLHEVQYNPRIRWRDVLGKFSTLQKQMDDLRDELASLPLQGTFLGNYVLVPGRPLPELQAQLAEIPQLLSTREPPAMEAHNAARRREAGPPVPPDRVEAHNALCDSLEALLGAAPPPPRA
eukprot:CAMPEP_0119293818 /NCGR_PEP_ID=MMETSP1329-20130426/46783_1 /TAXON_ID=114041 /ORGANISM="Genus nov. species nov., Strain RCC1024" /LENGTH=145 /DNA_ID=CAMNT_0007294691 /DNA_START=176 /DNA_END=610 /DNA_ORIENTATION=+